ncbi:hypothetical protein D3C77_748350 [compost metagenome]
MPLAVSDCIVGMQTFSMFHAQGEAAQPVQALQGQVQTSRGVFTEHQVLAVGQGKGLFIRALYRSLYGSA